MMVPQFRKLFLHDDWIMPVEVMRKPCALQKPQDKLRARVVKKPVGDPYVSECWVWASD